MIFSYNWIQSFFTEKLPKPQALAELLELHSFEVKETKKIGRDFSLDIDIMPNRPDCFSHLGIARECSAILGLKTKNNQPKIVSEFSFKNLKKKSNLISVEIKDQNDCFRYTGAFVGGISVGFSPKWMQQRLSVCNIQPINGIVDVANYTMLETGQPIHIFDYDKIAGKKIVVRRARKNEKISALDGKEYSLDQDILVISDEKQPLAIAGIKGGNIAAIDEKTKNIFIESATFDPLVIRKASYKLKLKTDASLRFEHGLDYNMTESAINKAISFVKKTSSKDAKIFKIDIFEKCPPKKIIKLDFNFAEKLLGVKISPKNTENILKTLGIKVFKKTNSTFDLEIPFERGDLCLPSDIAEEIIRIYGLERIKPTLPLGVLVPPQKNDELFWENQVKNSLKEMNFFEIYNYSFIKKNDGKNYFSLVELENPASEQFQYLRPTLLTGLIENLKINTPNYKEIKIFELEKVFQKSISGEIFEKKMLSGLIWEKGAKKGRLENEFAHIKGILDTLLNNLGISDYYFNEYKPNPSEMKLSFWDKNRVAEISLMSGKKIGFLGAISLDILGGYKIEEPVMAFDIDFEKLWTECSEECEYRPASNYPCAIRDIAVLVPRETKIGEVLNAIQKAGGEKIRDVDLFDFYEGSQIPQGKKNLAFHIIFQSDDKTLSGKEVDSLHKKIIGFLEKKEGWAVRK